MLSGRTWEMLCFTLEDELQAVKVPGETRIPAGRYQIKLRNIGGMTQRYQHNFPAMHRGMLWLQDVPGFEWIYIHMGNEADDTEGCILVGENRSEHLYMIEQSRNAYKRVYPRVAQAIVRGRGAFITVRDLDSSGLPHP